MEVFQWGVRISPPHGSGPPAPQALPRIGDARYTKKKKLHSIHSHESAINKSRLQLVFLSRLWFDDSCLVKHDDHRSVSGVKCVMFNAVWTRANQTVISIRRDVFISSASRMFSYDFAII